jgi:protein TonB
LFFKTFRAYLVLVIKNHYPMKTLLSVAFLIGISTFVQAQTIYYDSLWKEIPSRDGAFYYREMDSKNGSFCVQDFYISGKVQMKGCYSDFNYLIMEGLFTYYYENGQKSSEGTYKNNEKTKDWRYWDENGEEFIETMPEFPGGVDAMMRFLGNELVYPKDARKKGIEGRVVLQFVVNTDGGITNIEVLKSVYESLDNEAIRAVSQMPKWKPGTQQGKPVFVKFTLPIVFKLK